MLFPNSAEAPLKCWDMVNVADRPDFATNEDPQGLALIAMVQRLTSPVDSEIDLLSNNYHGTLPEYLASGASCSLEESRAVGNEGGQDSGSSEDSTSDKEDSDSESDDDGPCDDDEDKKGIVMALAIVAGVLFLALICSILFACRSPK